jgi:hypothetical protein
LHPIDVVAEVAVADHIVADKHLGFDSDKGTQLLDYIAAEGTEEEAEVEENQQLHKHLVVVASLLVVEERAPTDSFQLEGEVAEEANSLA